MYVSFITCSIPLLYLFIRFYKIFALNNNHNNIILRKSDVSREIYSYENNKKTDNEILIILQTCQFSELNKVVKNEFTHIFFEK